ncbi:MAG: YraN family protein [Micrococcales bacterium]
MTISRQWLGRYGEDRACEYLVGQGYQILDRNWRLVDGELDIVCSKDKTLVFVEVKTRTSLAAGSPLEAITRVKLAKLRRLAAGWCSQRQVSNTQVRFDAIGVLVNGGRVTIEHLRQVL